MNKVGSPLHDKDLDESGSQSSRSKFKRFQPKQIDQLSIQQKKKFVLAENAANLSLVHPKSNSKQKDGTGSSAGTPTAGMNRNNSHTILRSNKQDQRKSQKPPLAPKNVRFTFGKPVELLGSTSQVISKTISHPHFESSPQVGYSTITEHLERNFGGEWREPDSNIHSDSQFEVDSVTDRNLPSPKANLRKERELEQEIQKCRTARRLFLLKIKELKQMQWDLMEFVKDRLLKYETNISQLARQLTIRFERDLKTWQVQTEARMLSKMAAERRPGQENIRTVNTEKQYTNSSPMPKLDHTNIMDKLDKIKGKLDEMTKIKEDYSEDSTTATLFPGQIKEQVQRKRITSQLGRVTSVQQLKGTSPPDG